jgi:DNA repair exonuclease SbcCD nuclease subunit
MVKFAHLADCHLGGWRQEELQSLNSQTFQKAVERCIAERVDFVLISGDLFDSAYPPIEILKEAFAEFKKLHDARIPVYLIAGSHDFSASGKTFLDVLEKAGFCKNIENWQLQPDGRIKLIPHIHEGIAIYGYPGRKSGMELEDLNKAYFESIHPFTIFMIHTTIKDVVGNIPMESIEKQKLPLANYYAMGHIHQVFKVQERNSHYVYPGPLFPNNFQELVDLKSGSFELVDTSGGRVVTQNIKLPLKEVVYIELPITDGLTATEKIISELDKYSLRDKIFLLKLKGTLIRGKTGDIHFNEIEEFVRKKEVYVFLRNISAIKIAESDSIITSSSSDEVDNIEEKILKEYSQKNPADFNKYLPQIMNAFSMEKNEDEKANIFEERLISELNTLLGIKAK